MDPVAAYLADRYSHLLRLAYLLTAGDRPLAENILQTALLKLHRAGPREIRDLEAYAARCVIHEHRTWQRREARRRDRERSSAAPKRVSLPPEERLDVLRALDLLGDRERAAIVLRYFADVDDEQAARIIGCSRSTVRSLIHRALPKLRTALGEDTLEGQP